MNKKEMSANPVKMFKKKDQRKYLRKRCQKATAHLDRFVAGEDGNELHKFRLELKKIYAFLQFYRITGSELVSTRHDRAITKMFRQAGKIRDAHRFLQLAQDHLSGEPIFQSQQSTYIRLETGKFGSKIKDHRKKIKKIGRLLEARLHPIKTNCIRSWYASELVKAGKGLLGEGTDQLHRSRKGIKQLLYISGLLARSQTSALSLNRAYLDSLQEDIGQWHDLISFIQLLKEKEAAQTTIRELTEQAGKQAKSIQAAGLDFGQKAS